MTPPMKTLIFAAASLVLFAVQAEAARPTKKLVCKATGAVQTILSLVVEPTDLEGQICAISSDKKGQLSFFVSNGSVDDARILVAQKAWGRDGDYAVYLERSMGREGPEFFALQEYFTCNEDDIEFCHGANRKDPRKTATDTGLKCKTVEE